MGPRWGPSPDLLLPGPMLQSHTNAAGNSFLAARGPRSPAPSRGQKSRELQARWGVVSSPIRAGGEGMVVPSEVWLRVPEATLQGPACTPPW